MHLSQGWWWPWKDARAAPICVVWNIETTEKIIFAKSPTSPPKQIYLLIYMGHISNWNKKVFLRLRPLDLVGSWEIHWSAVLRTALKLRFLLKAFNLFAWLKKLIIQQKQCAGWRVAAVNVKVCVPGGAVGALHYKQKGRGFDGVIGISFWLHHSGRIMILRSTQFLTDMSTRNISWGLMADSA
jgi:hypothetical protein